VALLEVARQAIRAAAATSPLPCLPDDLPPNILEPAGAFVSLHRGSELRGCIGSLAPDHPLASVVARMAAAAATADPRFPPLRVDELADLQLEISIVSRTRRVPSEQIDPTRHGVALKLHRWRAVLLPQVATRYGWDRPTLLAHLCTKAGLPETAYADPAAVFRIFTVETVTGTLAPD
jgi:AmmeMemoRadiSam system protein A